MGRRARTRRRGTGDASAAEAWLRAIFDQTTVGIAVTDRERVAVACNGALAHLLGRPVGDIVGHRFAEFSHPDDVDRSEAVVRRVLDGEVDRAQVAKRYVRPDGSVVCARLTVAGLRDQSGRVEQVISVMEDLTARRRAEGDLRHHARHDPLTGLPNRQHVQAVLQGALSRTLGASGGTVGVIVVDLDDFGGVNDALGHGAGDGIMRQVASRISAAVTGGDLVARSTGDEFVVVRDRITAPAELAELADRVRAALVEPYALAGGRRVHLTATLGVTTGDGDGATADSLLRDAEIAVHEGRARRAGSVQWFDDALRRRVLDDAELVADLHDAVEHDELHLVYQPVVRLSDGAVVAAEALLRWNHPRRGPIAPRDFLGAIEGTALLSRVTWWVISAAARQAASWRGTSGVPVTVSVNVPAQVLLEADLVGTLEQILDAAGLPAPALVLELTEYGLVDDGPARLALDRLRRFGVHLYIDDFGTGWSSLSYIKRLPVHGLKIDQSFVRGLPDDPGDSSIATAITAMARGMGLSVVAEGVETSAQLRAVERLGVDYAQGFLLGRPSSPAALEGVWGRPAVAGGAALSARSARG